MFLFLSGVLDSCDDRTQHSIPQLHLQRSLSFKSFHHIFSVTLVFLMRIAARLHYSLFTFAPRKGDTAEAADNRDIESKVVPPPCVLGFIDTDLWIKNSPY